MEIGTTIRRALCMSVAAMAFVCQSVFAQLPEGAALFEAEKHVAASDVFETAYSLHSSGQYVVVLKGKAGAASGKAEIFRLAPLPFNDGEFTVWSYSKGLDLILSQTGAASGKTRSESWRWSNLGRCKAGELGGALSISAKLDAKPDAALDCVLLAKDPNFEPQGVYAGYSKEAIEKSAAGSSAEGNASGQAAIPSCNAEIRRDRTAGTVSKYIASHDSSTSNFLSQNAQVNAVLGKFLGGNIFSVIVRYNDGKGWDFEEMDKVVSMAKASWGADDILILPGWDLAKIVGRTDGSFTEEELAKGRSIFLDLVKRYASGPLRVKYWVVADEWPQRKQWKNEPDRFAAYYASLCKELKKLNPEIKVGGPVNCFPVAEDTERLLRAYPELDFISWNLYLDGRADAAISKLCERSKLYRENMAASRESARRILGRELPVICSGYGPNYHAWDPLDLRLSQPAGGFLDALALCEFMRGGAYSAMLHGVKALDTGIVGDNDKVAVKAGMLPANADPKLVNIRPAGMTHLFFKENFAGRDICEMTLKGDASKAIAAFSATDKRGNVSIALANRSATPVSVSFSVAPYQRPQHSLFDCPDTFIYCDLNSIRKGDAILLDSAGKGTLLLPGYSFYGLSIRCK